MDKKEQELIRIGDIVIDRLEQSISEMYKRGRREGLFEIFLHPYFIDSMMSYLKNLSETIFQSKISLYRKNGYFTYKGFSIKNGYEKDIIFVPRNRGNLIIFDEIHRFEINLNPSKKHTLLDDVKIDKFNKDNPDSYIL